MQKCIHILFLYNTKQINMTIHDKQTETAKNKHKTILQQANDKIFRFLRCLEQLQITKLECQNLVMGH